MGPGQEPEPLLSSYFRQSLGFRDASVAFRDSGNKGISILTGLCNPHPWPSESAPASQPDCLVLAQEFLSPVSPFEPKWHVSGRASISKIPSLQTETFFVCRVLSVDS